MSVRKKIKALISISLIVIILLMINNCFVYATELPRTNDQYMELKVVDISEVNGANKQVTLEWWSYNLKFQGLDLRFSYDESKIKPSSVQDNSYVTDERTFEFVGNFSSYMGYQVLQASDGIYRCYMSLENYSPGTYIEEDTTLDTFLVNTNVQNGVLIGRMSFRLYTNDNLDEDTFKLEPAVTSPQTGIKISQTYDTEYTEGTEYTNVLGEGVLPVFRFTVLSNDAKLKDLKYNFFNYIEENGTQTMPTIANTDYELLDLTNKETGSTDTVSKYKITLNDALESISLKGTLSNVSATVKVKTDQMENAEAWNTGQTKELALNPLGKGDTKITVLVTAQDGSTTHTYEITVHRPYATIKGSIYLNPLKNKGIYKGMVRVYKADDVKTIIDWPSVPSGKRDTIHSDLLTLDSIDQETEDDGSYEIYVAPGTYDILLDREGYLDHIITAKTVNERDVLDLGQKELFAGDFNKDGVIQLLDLSMLYSMYDVNSTSSKYNKVADINDDDRIQLLDLSALKTNYEKCREIE